MMSKITGAAIHIKGIVQGVGFRPFVYSLAEELDLHGWVRNTSAGVDIRLDGPVNQVQEFIRRVQSDKPPLAYIDRIEYSSCLPDTFTTFEIMPSEPIPGAFQPISPDICVCPECLNELSNPLDRRYEYPFINCTNCGPRFTIIQDIPYDRPNTTMSSFPMCDACRSEYLDPRNRRFHAQPVACPECGPQVWLESLKGTIISQRNQAIIDARQALQQGKILAIKGLGGFHLACDATNPDAVSELRRRKLRAEKPFAVMVADALEAAEQCALDLAEIELLTSRERPIVILSRLATATISTDVSPGQPTIGMFLPYTPLHYLLFNQENDNQDDHPNLRALVMTSGNLSEEPIATDNDEARQRLHSLADAYLMHNRPIHTRCDDSVVRVLPSMPNGIYSTAQDSIRSYQKSGTYPLRRSRGYAPFPVHLPFNVPAILATGAELKNTFCLAQDEYAFLSQHIGDMENYETYLSFEKSVAQFEKLYRLQPKFIAHDLHPDYLASRYAHERSSAQQLPLVGVQHHHAHIAACMVENGLDPDEPVIGIAFDGTGYGSDGAIWGGEFLVSTLTSFQRAAHLAYFPLPGGDLAIRKPARIALAYLWQAGLEWQPEFAPYQALCAEERTALHAQLKHAINTPVTSSMGRLFDAVASLASVRQKVSYEAQAAIELEAWIDPTESGAYEYSISTNAGESTILIDPCSVIRSVAEDALQRTPPSKIAARFHNATTLMILEVCSQLRKQYAINRVALSGGVWQNMALLGSSSAALITSGFSVYLHQRVPANDGGISLGQAAVAGALYRDRTE